jgi:hypothetical protein
MMLDIKGVQIMARKSFQFTVQGNKQAGVIYITQTFENLADAIVRATKLAAKRSGDTAPKYIRTVSCVR